MEIKPTDEQMSAIKMTGKLDRIKGFALAGTGKTTLLNMIANHLPEHKILYLAFNKPIAEEAKGKMPRNVEVRTIHSLAYKHIGKYFKIQNPDYSLLAQKMKTDIKNVFRNIKYFHHFTQSNLSFYDENGLANLIESDGAIGGDIDRSVKFVRKLYKMMFEKEVPITHDFYLKLYERNIKKIKSSYDIVLLDEAQDSNMVTCSVFNGLPGKKIMIGDTFQKIYGFRGAINAMETWEADDEFSLTESFRFCSKENITPFQVEQANFVLNNFLNSDLTIKVAKIGNKEPETSCVLCRRNSSVVEELDGYEDLKTIRHPDMFFKTIFDVFNKKRKIGKESENFTGYVTDLEELSSESGDLDIVSACKLIKKYCFSKQKFKELHSRACVNYSNPNLKNTVGTAHSSKGLEFDNVRMVDDFVKVDDILTEIINDYSLTFENDYLTKEEVSGVLNRYITNKDKEELNLLYMAYTRARVNLDTSVTFDESYKYMIPKKKTAAINRHK